MSHLYQTIAEECHIQLSGLLSGFRRRKLDVSETLRATIVYVARDGYAIDRAAGLKVLDQLDSHGVVVHVADVHGPEEDNDDYCFLKIMKV